MKFGSLCRLSLTLAPLPAANFWAIGKLSENFFFFVTNFRLKMQNLEPKNLLIAMGIGLFMGQN